MTMKLVDINAHETAEQSLKNHYHSLLNDLQALAAQLQLTESQYRSNIETVHSNHTLSAKNLVHYLTLRRQDLRPLQQRLSDLGLSSLGGSDCCVAMRLKAMIVLLEQALHLPVNEQVGDLVSQQSLNSGSLCLQQNAEEIFASTPEQRTARILVTLPTEVAHNAALAKDMMLSGMDAARINCAHDDMDTWLKMIQNVRQVSQELNKPCPILMDLPGPKLRTGNISCDIAVLKIKPQHNAFGLVTEPARVLLVNNSEFLELPENIQNSPILPIQGIWLKHVEVGDLIEFEDTRGKKRVLQVTEATEHGMWCSINKTAYVTENTCLKLIRIRKRKSPMHFSKQGLVAAIPASRVAILVRRGDTIILTRDQTPGIPTQIDEQTAQVIAPARVPCSLPDVFAMVKVGEKILFDDGRFSGVIQQKHADELDVLITQARDEGDKLMADKGINLPDSRLKLAALSTSDIECLEFIVQHADMVGLSFVNQAKDIKLLQQHLKRLNAENKTIIVKIETRAGFEHLPEIIFALMKSPNIGLMIARGDLAVECGFERLAELQEEILSISDAAHLPVIWATQVLETAAKTGTATRAEISDAAMSERAECVMLNKGPHILVAIDMLDDILVRMQGHQNKKRALLRRLHW